MELKIAFTIINIISTILLAIVGINAKIEGEKYISSIKRLIFAAAAAVASNILIANAPSTSVAYFAYCLYFTSLDWVCFSMYRFCLEYTNHVIFKTRYRSVAFFICLLDSIFLYTNLISPYIYEVYTVTDPYGTLFYLTKLHSLYYIHLAVDYALILVAVCILVYTLMRSYSIYVRKYSSIVLIIAFIIISNIVYMTFALYLDFSVLFYAIAGIAIYYYAALYIPNHIKNQSFAFVIDSMNEGLILFDKDKNCIFANAMVDRELGITAHSAAIHSGIIRDIIKDHDTETEDQFTTRYHTEGDSPAYYKVNFQNIFDKKHRIIGSFFIFENITVEHNAFEQMALAQREADKANKAKSIFLANMSHEIRTPINSVLGLNEMILRESEDEQILDYAQNIDTAGNALLMLISDVLDFSKIEAGRLEIIEDNYSFQKLLNECYVMLIPRAEAKNLDFTIECDANIPRTLYGDKNRILQILINVISNAIKYTHSGSVKVNVAYDSLPDYNPVENFDNPQQHIRLRIDVSDTGIGISKENQAKLFTAFTRVDQNRNREIEGTGLGLAITKQLSELMDGDITITSEVDKGSTFTVTLIQRVVDAAPGGAFGEQNSAKETSAHKESFTAPRAKILVVDDVKMNLKVVTALLKRTQIQVTTASSGTEAIKLCDETKFDLILMDHMMPEPDGVETFKIIRNGDSINKETPMIILTANAVNGASEEYIKTGFEGYLSKPVKGKDLEDAIINILPKDLID